MYDEARFVLYRYLKDIPDVQVEISATFLRLSKTPGAGLK